ncbi:MAG TPA: 3-dehydroquinate synthase [Gammaproteobacteria bacterium]|nr:3-dehydroquinate synthase [Gammaproteobacteria bacterium]
METLTVELKERSYPIFIGTDILGQAELIRPYIHGNQVMIITNETIAPLYLESCKAALSDFQVESVILPDGEQYKNLDTLNSIFDALLTHRFNRHATLVALGGGVIGDIAGFAASAYQRGIPFIQIPTTLLAQVDSSVGGKTAVNHPLGKNMIGAFYQPQCVIADTNTLDTLEDRQLKSGIAEVIKYGLINDYEFFSWLEANMDKLLQRDHDAFTYAVKRSCQDKADIVAMDETEQGVRALLNLGHTFGHAIETGMGYGQWLHGESVATGICMAAHLSALNGDLGQKEVKRIQQIIKKAQLPTESPPELSSSKMLSLMSVDKKNVDSGIRLILLKAIGHAVLSDDYRTDDLQATLNYYCKS